MFSAVEVCVLSRSAQFRLSVSYLRSRVVVAFTTVGLRHLLHSSENHGRLFQRACALARVCCAVLGVSFCFFGFFLCVFFFFFIIFFCSFFSLSLSLCFRCFGFFCTASSPLQRNTCAGYPPSPPPSLDVILCGWLGSKYQLTILP